MGNEKTHYRKAFDSPYLSAADITEPTVLTIKYVKLEPDKTKKTRDKFNTAYFVEKEIRQGEELKPMILNATNSRTLKNLTGSAFIDDWNSIPVTVYVDPSVRFGGSTVEGLRISTERPITTKPRLTRQNADAWARAVARCKKDGNLAEVLKHMSISDEDSQAIFKEAGIVA